MTLKSSILGAALLALIACSPAPKSDTNTDTSNTTAETSAEDKGVVNIYSSRHYDTDLRLYSDFTDQTGIKVNRIEAKANALIERLKSEGEFSPADLLITVDAGIFWRAEKDGLIQPIDSEILEERVPAHMRHPDGYWYSLAKRARVMIYNKDNYTGTLKDYADLADPANKGKVCMRSSSNAYNITLLASLVANEGEEKAQEWANGVVANLARKPQSNDSGQIEAVAAGICDVSLVNSYYLARYARSEDPAKRAIFDKLGIVFPNQDGRGTHVNISGAALTAHAPNKDNAIKFLEYLTSKSAQTYLVNSNNEYPVIDLGEDAFAVKILGTYKEDELNVLTTGKLQPKAVDIFDAAGWQ